MSKYVAAITLVLVGAVNANAAIGSAEAARLAEAAQVVQGIRTDIPPDIWSRSRCLAVIPDLKKAAFIFGGELRVAVVAARESRLPRGTADQHAHTHSSSSLT